MNLLTNLGDLNLKYEMTTYPLTRDKIEFDNGLISSSSSDDKGSLILSIFPCFSSFQDRRVSSNSFKKIMK